VIAAGERSEALLTEAIAQVNADSSLTPAEKEEQITALEKQYPLNKDEVYIYQGPDSYSSNQYHNLFQ
jgi:hypothetical protein